MEPWTMFWLGCTVGVVTMGTGWIVTVYAVAWYFNKQ